MLFINSAPQKWIRRVAWVLVSIRSVDEIDELINALGMKGKLALLKRFVGESVLKILAEMLENHLDILELQGQSVEVQIARVSQVRRLQERVHAGFRVKYSDLAASDLLRAHADREWSESFEIIGKDRSDHERLLAQGRLEVVRG